MSADQETHPNGQEPGNNHRSVIIVLTIVMVIIPLLLGALRLMGRI